MRDARPEARRRRLRDGHGDSERESLRGWTVDGIMTVMCCWEMECAVFVGCSGGNSLMGLDYAHHRRAGWRSEQFIKLKNVRDDPWGGSGNVAACFYDCLDVVVFLSVMEGQRIKLQISQSITYPYSLPVVTTRNLMFKSKLG